jgi:hypothetical protein
MNRGLSFSLPLLLTMSMIPLRIIEKGATRRMKIKRIEDLTGFNLSIIHIYFAISTDSSEKDPALLDINLSSHPLGSEGSSISKAPTRLQHYIRSLF